MPLFGYAGARYTPSEATSPLSVNTKPVARCERGFCQSKTSPKRATPEPFTSPTVWQEITRAVLDFLMPANFD